ncbi:MAG: VWA domain-containing protein [Pirellulaceae bacterium]|nr:VWA domain-containing protein [Pirellulaceae bacterium]
MHTWGYLLADATETYHEFARLETMTEVWQWLLLLLVCAGVLVYSLVMYAYDSVELPRALAVLLIGLRLAAFFGILFYFMDLEKRSRRELVHPSRTLVLVDTSQSMGLQDSDSTSVPAGPSRIDLVIEEFQRGELLPKLRAQHDVVVYGFDETTRPRELATFAKLPGEGDRDPDAVRQQQRDASLRQSRLLAGIAGGVLLVSLLAGLVFLISRQFSATAEGPSWALLVSIVTVLAAVVILAVASLRTPDVGLLALWGLRDPAPAESPEQVTAGAPVEDAEQPPVDWATELVPRGVETRIGDALRYVVNKERGGPIAGVVLISDGRENEGSSYQVAAAAAQAASIPVHAVGMGSDKRQTNVRVVDLEAPERVYPGDKFQLSGYLQAFGMGDRLVTVELLSGPAGSEDPATESSEEVRRVRLADDGEIQTLEPFVVTPEEEGRRQYRLRITNVEDDLDQRDNDKIATVEVVERRSRVLLIAGGPTREYRFLRNMLFRDRDTVVDVYLQTAEPGVSQEADDVLFEFPDLADELFEYDCIVAFDPDWLALTDQQVELLERWVSEKAGGLIVVAGPVFTPQWTRLRRGADDRVDTLKALYPVVFYYQGSATLSLGRFGGTAAWPLEFTREGQEAEFLWLEDDAISSEQGWAGFEGVFGYYAVKDPKPGARVYARFSDPETAIDGELPIYMAGQFYGAGRVFFQASGEVWRLRSVDDTYFEAYYTKLIRWASQGRLLRDSSRGVLLVEKDRCVLGEQVSVRAILTDPQHQPLAAEQVDAVLVKPDSTRTTLTLRKLQDSAREGTFAGQFTALQKGDYRVELTPPEAGQDELLARDVRVLVPQKEIQQPQRHDALLKELADRTGGEYYIGLDAAMSRGGPARQGLVEALVPQDHVSFLPGTPDKSFERQLMIWLMAMVCGVLSVEWLIRRLSKLA